MAKVYLFCGKICSGKSYYAKKMTEEKQAVILSCDELMLSVLPQDLGEDYSIYSEKSKNYLHARTVDIVRAGCNVILDWGFWYKKERADISKFYEEHGIEYEWHYIDISEEKRRENIQKRNAEVIKEENQAYYVDEGLFEKCNTLFEVPDETENMEKSYANKTITPPERVG